MRWIDSLYEDLKHAARALRSAPGIAAVVSLSLALGIGANTAIFSLLNAVLLRPLPVVAPERLVVLDDGSWTNPIWEEIRDHQQPFEGVLAWSNVQFDLADGGETRFARGMFVSGSYFEVLGVAPLLGRVFAETDDARSCGDDGPLAVLSHGFWQSQYGGRASVLGQTVSLDGHPFTIIGVTPPRFFGTNVGETFDVAVPICSEAIIRGSSSALDQRSYWWLEIMGRLGKGVTRLEAEASLRSLQPAIREATLPGNWPEEYQAKYLDDAFTLSDGANGLSRVRTRYGESLLVIMAISALVLLVACSNIANLLLARARTRDKELALRVSLGASQSRLFRQLLMESVLLGLTGALAGIAFARWASRLLVTQLSTGTRPVFLETPADGSVLAFATGVGVLTGVVFGALPALTAARSDPNEVLRRTSRTGGGAGASRWLVSLQVALSLVLVFGAGLFVRSYSILTTMDPGFDPSSVLTVRADIRRVAGNENEPQTFHLILEALRGTPSVSSAAATAITPISGASWNNEIQVDGYQPISERDRLAYYNYVSPDYFRTLGSPLLMGRDFGSGDTATSRPVAIANQALADKFFFGRALGKTYRVRDGDSWDEVLIVGIVRDAKYRRLTEESPPTAYSPIRQIPRARPVLSYLVRGRGDLETLRRGIVASIENVSPGISLTFRTLDSQVADSLVQERLLASLSVLFGMLALTVASVGLSGLIAYVVSRQQRELGIRSALGATPKRLVLHVSRDIAFVIGLGLALGALVALGSGKLVSSLLYGLGGTDPETLLLAAVLLALVSASSGLVPARRAARVDPMDCLRAE